MKILKLKKVLENESRQLEDLEEGDSFKQDFELILEDENNGQKYEGKVIITKIPDEDKQ